MMHTTTARRQMTVYVDGQPLIIGARRAMQLWHDAVDFARAHNAPDPHATAREMLTQDYGVTFARWAVAIAQDAA